MSKGSLTRRTWLSPSGNLKNSPFFGGCSASYRDIRRCSVRDFLRLLNRVHLERAAKYFLRFSFASSVAPDGGELLVARGELRGFERVEVGAVPAGDPGGEVDHGTSEAVVVIRCSG